MFPEEHCIWPKFMLFFSLFSSFFNSLSDFKCPGITQICVFHDLIMDIVIASWDPSV